MKAFKITILSLLLFFTALVLFLETSFGANFVHYLLMRALKQNEVFIEVGRIKGRLNHTIEIEDLKAGPVDVDRAKFRLALPSLLRGRLEIEQLRAEGVRWNPERATPTMIELPLTIQIDSFSIKQIGTGIPIDAKGDALLYRKGGGRLKVHLQSKQFEIEANGKWDRGSVFYASFEAETQQAKIHGTIDGTLADWKGNIAGKYNQETFDATINGRYFNDALSGDILLHSRFRSEMWTAKSNFFYRPKGALTLPSLEIHSPSFEGKGELSLRPDLIWIGKMGWTKGSLSLLTQSIPFVGSTQGKIEFSSESSSQAIDLTVDAQEFYAGHLYAKQGTLHGRYVAGSGAIEAAFDQLIYQDLSLDHSQIQFGWNLAGPAPFCLSGQGFLRGPLDLSAGGEFDLSNRLIQLEWAGGTLFGKPAGIKNEAIFQWSKDRAAIEHLNASVGSTFVYIDYLGYKHESHLDANIQNFPLNAAGDLHFRAHIEKEDGDFFLHAPFGDFKGTISKSNLQGELHGKASGNLSIPIDFSLWPLKFEPAKNKMMAGKFQYQGRVEELIDPFDLGSHYAEGNCAVDATIHGTPAHPKLKGSIKITDGAYQNYWSGTELAQISADLALDGGEITLTKLTAKDVPGSGTFTADGKMDLNVSQKFPFSVDLHLDNVALTEIDLVKIYASGEAVFSGNFERAKVAGDLTVNRSIVTIPDQITKQLPNLQVVYKNGSEVQAMTPPELSRDSYLIDLDLRVDVPKNLTIEGRGLNSEWTGDFVLQGDTRDPAARGKIELVEGEFRFANKTFHLTDGILSMDGKPDHLPELNIAGVWAEKGISILVRLKGPLNEPQVTFQSTPPLPLNGILSYLLFGQDISEITAFQALQLLNTAANISGSSPDILETTRKSLGIDRLRIISKPTLGEGEDSIALQVGQYVAEGVIISVSQGAEESSTNISIEVDLSQGFVFQAETLQEEEQGKFTIKWNRNY